MVGWIMTLFDPIKPKDRQKCDFFKTKMADGRYPNMSAVESD